MNDRLPILSSGKQDEGSGKVCAEQAVGWLVSGRLDLGDETDHPDCVQPVLNALAIAVNDRLSDEHRGQMWPLILRQPGTAHPEMEPVLSVRLAAFLAEQVLDLVAPGDWQVCRDAITAAQVWADNPNSETAAAYAATAATAYAAADAAAYAAANAAAAAYAATAATAYAAANAAYAAANAAYAAYAAATAAAATYAAYAATDATAYAAANDGRLLALLAAAQDECERLTGHVPAAPSIERLERLGELVGTK